MKKFTIFLLLFCFLSPHDSLRANPENEKSLSQEIEKGWQRSKEFILSKDMANLLLFGLSSGFLIYLPKHLSKYSSIAPLPKNNVDKIIEFPRNSFFNFRPWSHHLYYELATLLAGYFAIKTGQPYFNKITKS